MVALIRKWHSWVGVAAALFLFVTAVTGIGLNHRDLIFGPKDEGVGQRERGERSVAVTPILAEDVAALPISLEQALRTAEEHLGHETALGKVELTTDRERLLYRVTGDSDHQIEVDAVTGKATKSQIARLRRESSGGGIEMSRFIKDLHTGKLLGGPGKLLLDFIALSMMALACTGTWLWAWPRLRMQKQRGRLRSEVGA